MEFFLLNVFFKLQKTFGPARGRYHFDQILCGQTATIRKGQRTSVAEIARFRRDATTIEVGKERFKVLFICHPIVFSFIINSLHFRRKIDSLRNATKPHNKDDDDDDTVDNESAQIRSTEYDIKYCEQCLEQYNFAEATRPCTMCRQRAQLNWCGRCHNQLIREKVYFGGN